MNLIKRWGGDWRKNAPLDFLLFRNEPVTKERQEVVVALRVLPAEVNLGYHSWTSWVIDKVNGQDIKNFQQFVKLVHNNKEEFVVIKDRTGYSMVLDHNLATESRDSILATYRVPHYHSKDLFIEPIKQVKPTEAAKPITDTPTNTIPTKKP